MLYCEVERTATNLQGDKVCISNAIQFVSKLVETLEDKKEDFDTFWTDMMDKRREVNEGALNIQRIQTCSFYTAIEEPSCPRASLVILREIHNTEEEAMKAY